MEKIQQRLDYLDIAKAIGIFFVIVGHVAGNLDAPFYHVVLYYFHMPLFFMITGLLISRKEIEFNKEYIKNFIYKNLYAISGSFAVIAFSLIISRMFKNHQENRVYKRILWIGSNTIAVFLLHKPFLQQVVLWDFKALALPDLSG